MENGEKVSEIANELQVSRKKVYNAIKSCLENPDVLIKGKSRKHRKTNLRTDAAMVRMAKIDSFKSSRQIASDVNESFGLEISSRIVSRRLNEANLFGRISRKNHCCQKKKCFKTFSLRQNP